MDPSNTKVNWRLRALIAMHIVLGLVCVAACLIHDSSVWHPAAEFSFLVLFGSQMLLLGISLGVSGMSWWQATYTACCGLAYLMLIAISAGWSRGYLPIIGNDLLFIGCAIGLPTLIVAGGLLIIQRKAGMRVVRLENPPQGLAIPFRFSIRHLLFWMFGFALVLGMANWIRGASLNDGSSIILFGLILGTASLAIVWLVVWVAWGEGSPLRPLILVLFAAATIGLIPPCLQRDAPAFRYVVWPSLTFAITAIVAGTLLALRGVGFRLVASGGEASPFPNVPKTLW